MNCSSYDQAYLKGLTELVVGYQAYSTSKTSCALLTSFPMSTYTFLNFTAGIFQCLLGVSVISCQYLLKGTSLRC